MKRADNISGSEGYDRKGRGVISPRVSTFHYLPANTDAGIPAGQLSAGVRLFTGVGDASGSDSLAMKRAHRVLEGMVDRVYEAVRESLFLQLPFLT